MSTTRIAAFIAVLVLAAIAPYASAQESAAARAALDRAVAFAGGFDRVYAMRTLVVSSVVRRATEAGAFSVPTRTSYAFPLKVRHEVVINDRTLALASAPGGGTAFTEDGPIALDEATRVGIERATMRHPLVLLKSRRGRGFRAEHEGVERFDGGDADLVRIVQVANETVLAIDRVDGRMIEIRYRLSARDGTLRPIVVRFDDWRSDAYGIKSPRIARGFENGAEVFVAQSDRVEVDVALADALFTAGLAIAGHGTRP